jgi:hypothetical protein
MDNRGKIPTSRIAEKLNLAKKEISISHQGDNAADHPILFVNGRLNRKKCNYIAKNFSLLEPIEAEIKKYCKGIDLAILNYLLFRGIESVKKGEKKFVEYSDIESQYQKDDYLD